MQLRIKLDSAYKERANGPSMFMSRIIRVLEKNHNIKFTSKKPHINFGVIFLPDKGAKRIVRIDGCYYNKAHTSSSINKAVAKSINKADGVIFQSEFSKKLCEKLLGVQSKKSCVIYNGIDHQWVNSVSPTKFPEENVFAAVASWRNSKRPKSIIRSFLEADIPDSKLLMIGKFEKRIKHHNILYLGSIPSEKVISYLKGCKALIHLSKIESCSNSIVESLSCRVPVVCNNIGGSPEIVGNDGIIVECDPKFDFRFINEKNVDNINPKTVSPALVDMSRRTWNIVRPDLDINYCALQYYNFFKMICNV